MRSVSSSACGFLSAFLLFDHGLRSRKARHRNSEWGGAHVIHSDAMAEFHAGPVAPMLAADSNLQIWTCGTPALNAPFDQHPDARNVERLERIAREYSCLALVHIFRQEPACIVTREPHHSLRQIIGAEREELSDFRNLVCKQRGARKLNHRAN